MPEETRCGVAQDSPDSAVDYVRRSARAMPARGARRRRAMKTVAYEARVENGTIRLLEPAQLPEQARVIVVLPDEAEEEVIPKNALPLLVEVEYALRGLGLGDGDEGDAVGGKGGAKGGEHGGWWTMDGRRWTVDAPQRNGEP